ncbi:pentatricopeptide repeat-containing protein at2g20540 [Phtheirospermum japonicum]|uniref:Pentatricopeptide repeat-containing protein at2g20540 n=1 Tax=Phtheirospermum japonicum TaxID=374723 RepID=A0A830B6W8_9LAMI|nr:pentatricopeptide repeat-containing protein at2g20540 [Phtheirospermum japonicum]
MIRAYTHNRVYVSSIDVYKKLLRHRLKFEEEIIFPDRFTYPFVIRSCGALVSVCSGKQVHGHVCKFGLTGNNMIESSLLDMYMKLGHVRKARLLFDDMPNRSIVSWTAMISGYTKIGHFGDALDLFRTMQVDGMRPDWVSLVSVLPACAQLGSLELGKWIHFYAEKNGFLRKNAVCNALIEMYTKCGSVGQALQVFDKMPERDVISWSTMIAGLAHHGRAQEAIQLFRDMQKANVGPNEITFVGLLSACGHAGLLDDGLKYFESMKNVYNIEPGIEHYGCLVDLLGRTGHIDRALKLIKSMKIKPDSAIWGSLLSSCRTYRNLKIAVVAMENLLELEPEDTGNLILLANIYADLGKWEEVSRMRKFIRSKSMKKTPGCSLIEVDSAVQEFIAGDDSKPFCREIFGILEILAVHQIETDDWVEIEPEDL